GGHRGRLLVGTSVGVTSAGRDSDAPAGVARARTRRGIDERSGDVGETLAEAAGVALLGASKRLEPLGDLREALLASGLREARVHLGVLVGLTGDRRLEVVLRRADRLTGRRVAHLG